jgi:hypothetical protein
MYRNTSLPASATVCRVSANRAGEPVNAAAVPLAIAIVVLAASAVRTLPRLSSRASAFIASLFRAIPPVATSGM